MLNILYKLFSEIEPNEIRKAITEYYDELPDDSLFKHYYIKYNDLFPNDLWFKSLVNITLQQQLRDYIADVDDLIN